MPLETQTYRFHGLEAARLVADQFQRMCNAQVEIGRDPLPEDDRKRGVGDWKIEATGPTYVSTATIGVAMNAALECALAEQLRRFDPDNPLLRQVWHLRAENRERTARRELFNVHR